MDPRLEVTDPPRPLPTGVSADTPLLTLAWRALAAEHRQRGEERQAAADEARGLREALLAVADEVLRLRRQDSPALTAAAARLEEALARAGVTLLTPTGEPYEYEMLEFLENVTQRREPGLAGPRVAEVLSPVVFYRGGLWRMGRAVIAVPADGTT